MIQTRRSMSKLKAVIEKISQAKPKIQLKPTSSDDSNLDDSKPKGAFRAATFDVDDKLAILTPVLRKNVSEEKQQAENKEQADRLQQAVAVLEENKVSSPFIID